MKNPFQKTQMQQLETTIASLTNRGEQLAAKRVTAHDALDKAIKSRQQTLLSGDLDDQRTLDKLQGAVDTAASTLAGIDDVLAVLAQQKAEAESQLAAECERVERAAAADKLDKQVVAIEAALPGYLEQSRALADALSKIGDWHFESGQMAGFLQNTMGQIEIAANFALAELKALPEAIRQGRQAIPREPVPTPVAVPEPPPTVTIFMLRSAHYLDHDGRKRFAGQWEDATMPVATAQRVLDKGIAVAVTDPRRAQLRGARGGDFNPHAPDVVDLDAVEENTGVPHIEPDPVLRQANFTPVDRSAEARTIQIEVPRL
ncbi:hypothetical protein [Bradyrhizobium sp. AZCC 2289]|uniref:hypothetical protein n=1 Tax=Bradyrhizobium sp. AZCC 2289 TaxID=3117026 RepID=UPI002FEFC7A0